MDGRPSARAVASAGGVVDAFVLVVARRNRRISAQSSTLITPPDRPREGSLFREPQMVSFLRVPYGSAAMRQPT